MQQAGTLGVRMGLVTILMASMGAAAAAETPADTEARNAAAGFAITVSLTLLESLGKQCGTYEGEAGSQARAALQGWQQRNHRYLEPSLQRVLMLTDAVTATAGEAEGKAFAEARKVEFTGAATTALRAMFPDGEVTTAACARIATATEEGMYDYRRHAEFFPTLEVMAQGATAPSAMKQTGGRPQMTESMQSEAETDESEKWLLLRSLTDDRPHFVGVIPALPPPEVRAAFPQRITIVVAYEENEKGLPLYADDLDALNGLEDDMREWDPERRVFLNAARSTGLGERRWTLYATDVDAMKALVPENDFMDISAEHDPEWSEIAAILAGVPAAH